MKIVTIISLLLPIFLFTNCTKDDYTTNYTNDISGYFQGGQFLKNSKIVIHDLNAGFKPNGRTYRTTTINNIGYYEIGNIKSESGFIQISGTGICYNELSAYQEIDSVPLQLYCIADIRTKSEININILTHLEYKRVLSLVHNGMEFSIAKNKAQAEMLHLINLHEAVTTNSEDINRITNSNNNKALLALSLVAVGFRSNKLLQPFLTKISDDMQHDGILNNDSIKSALYSHAYLLPLEKIRRSIYANHQINNILAQIPNFETYVNNYITDSTNVLQLVSYFPEITESNILMQNINELTGNSFYIAANKPTLVDLTIKIIPLNADGNWLIFDNSKYYWGLTTNEIFLGTQNYDGPGKGRIWLDKGVYQFHYIEKVYGINREIKISKSVLVK